MADNITHSKFETLLSIAVSNITTSTDYELWYRTRALKYAILLQKDYGGDIDIICASVILKILDTKYFEFSNIQNNNSLKLNNILQSIDFPSEKITAVVNYTQYLTNHALSSVEEKITNDALILASLGAAGLVRFFMWSEFAQSKIDEFERIDNLFKERLARLITSQGIRLAEKENKFVYLFSALLKQEPKIETNYPGKYIILEGNSGTGKDSQADLIKNYFDNNGYEVSIVKEPSQIYRDFEAYIESTTNIDLTDSAPIFRLYSIIGDRYSQIHEKVIQELQQGKVVISVRSYISMLVYQCETESERLFVNFLHNFLPRPDVIILYDANEDICLQRVLNRGTKMTPFDKLENLKKFRPIYLDIINSNYFDFPFEIVDASGTVEQVAAETIRKILQHL